MIGKTEGQGPIKHPQHRPVEASRELVAISELTKWIGEHKVGEASRWFAATRAAHTMKGRVEPISAKSSEARAVTTTAKGAIAKHQ